MFTLALFSVTLIACIAAGLPVLWALAAGYVIFFVYGLRRGHSPAAVFRMSVNGAKTSKNILITFFLIGILTALWRAAGTIPAIVCCFADFMRPSVMILMAFFLNGLVSFLTGSAFGTSATMGVISMTMANAMGCNPLLTGGAILSGVFWGDRCSPVSTSALLTAELTGTNIYTNIRLMLKTSLIPTLAASLIYAGAGFLFPAGAPASLDIEALFGNTFRLGLLPTLPAILLLILALRRVPVRTCMGVSIVTAFLLCAVWQREPVVDILRWILFGFHTADPELASMIDGGGIRSMVNVALIVCLSSSYSGIFDGTGLLDGIKDSIARLAAKTSSYTVILFTSVLASMIACNQTLATILTHQLCQDIEPDRQRLAISLENSVIILAPLVPWSIAGTVPLASVGAPLSAIPAACYLYLLPLWCLLTQKRGQAADKG